VLRSNLPANVRITMWTPEDVERQMEKLRRQFDKYTDRARARK
jgi:hypothetical protein